MLSHCTDSLEESFVMRIVKTLSITVLIILMMVAIGVCTAASADSEFTPSLAVSDPEYGEETKILSWGSYQEKQYLFLPSCFRASRLKLDFLGKSGEINGTAYETGDIVSLPLNQELPVKVGNKSFSLIVMQSANIPAMFIQTESGSKDAIYKSKTVKEPGMLTMLDVDGNAEYDGSLQYIRTRGNSTFNYVKKPFQIKLESSASLAGMKKDKTYILLANYLDRSCIRNSIALDLARYSGAYAFTPAFQSVDLYLNHEYMGCYLLTEKCEIDPDRLNLINLEEATEKLNDQPLSSYPTSGNSQYTTSAKRGSVIPNDPEDITGGYIIVAVNTNYFKKEVCAFSTKRGQSFIMQEPKYASLAQVGYISGVMQEIEDALFAKDGNHPVTGRHYTEMLDMTSFVNRYLQAELMNDFDGQRPYFYKNRDAIDPKVYCGPVWDQDNTLGASSRRTQASILYLSAGDEYHDYYWFTRAYQQPDFRQELNEAYQKVYQPALAILLGERRDEKGILRSIDEYGQEVRASVLMNDVRWSYGRWSQEQKFNSAQGRNIDECIIYLKRYLSTRRVSLDKAFGSQ